VAQIRTSFESHLTVGPGLLRGPFDGVVAVRPLRTEWVPLAFGLVPAAHILDESGIALLREFDQRLLNPVPLHAVRCANDEHRELAFPFRPVEIAVELHSVAHGNGKMALNTNLLAPHRAHRRGEHHTTCPE